MTYNLAMPASILSEGRLSNLQLEAVVYGCQRHLVDLPTEEPQGWEVAKTPIRAGFLLGDGAGMGKGRTLAGFVIENIARGRKKHVWISVSADLYEGEGVVDTCVRRGLQIDTASRSLPSHPFCPSLGTRRCQAGSSRPGPGVLRR